MSLQLTLKALSDPIRREILNLLKAGPMSAGDISARFDVTGAAVSRHLSVLKDADLIRDRRDENSSSTNSTPRSWRKFSSGSPN